MVDRVHSVLAGRDLPDNRRLTRRPVESSSVVDATRAAIREAADAEIKQRQAAEEFMAAASRATAAMEKATETALAKIDTAMASFSAECQRIAQEQIRVLQEAVAGMGKGTPVDIAPFTAAVKSLEDRMKNIKIPVPPPALENKGYKIDVQRSGDDLIRTMTITPK